MNDDQTSSELLKQLIERLDLLERVLGSNTARLHSIEKHLGIVRPLDETLARARGDAHPATPQVKTEDLSSSEAPLLTTVMPQALKAPEPTRSQAEAQVPSTSETAATPSMPDAPATHSWMNEASASPTPETREAATPSPLHLQVEKTAAAGDQTPPRPEVDSDAVPASAVHEYSSCRG